MTGSDVFFWVVVALVIIDFGVRIVAIIVVPRNRRPTSGMAWLLTILFIPYVGILAFLLIGNTKLPRARREKQAEISRVIRESTDGMERVSQQQSWPPWLESVVVLNRNLGATPLVGENQAELIGNYHESLTAMTREIGRARAFVHVEFYILVFDTTTAPFFDALEAAIGRGVTVRVLLDHVAWLRARGHRRTLRKLKKIGVQWQFTLPVQPLRGKYQRFDLRNHRKLLIVDGGVGFMGSQNIVDRSYNKRRNKQRGLRWHDLMARFDGPVVAGLNTIFITDWYTETGELLPREPEVIVSEPRSGGLDCQVVPSGPGFESENNLRLFLTLLYCAREQIIISSPYFVPDEAMLYAITSATERGVAVELFVSEIGDQALVYHAQRSYYEALLRAGVTIWMYRAPDILHAKHFTIDDDVAVIGSSNMDMRSFSLNMEVSLMVCGESFVRQMREVEAGYRSRSRQLTLDEWMRQPLRSTILDNLARLTSGLQ
jgi:cardiolipin synthase